jgi:hypothetical protein
VTAAGLHPYCAVVVSLVPLDPQGRPQPARAVTLSGVGGPIYIEPQELKIEWVPDPDTGTRFTLNGAREWV